MQCILYTSYSIYLQLASSFCIQPAAIVTHSTYTHLNSSFPSSSRKSKPKGFFPTILSFAIPFARYSLAELEKRCALNDSPCCCCCWTMNQIQLQLIPMHICRNMLHNWVVECADKVYLDPCSSYLTCPFACASTRTTASIRVLVDPYSHIEQKKTTHSSSLSQFSGRLSTG